MEHIAALLLIIGCSQDLKQCNELPAPVPLYEVVEDCQRDLASSLKVYDGARPRIFAQCVAVDPALAEEDAELVWDILPNGTLEATLSAPEVEIAANASSEKPSLYQQ